MIFLRWLAITDSLPRQYILEGNYKYWKKELAFEGHDL